MHERYKLMRAFKSSNFQQLVSAFKAMHGKLTILFQNLCAHFPRATILQTTSLPMLYKRKRNKLHTTSVMWRAKFHEPNPFCND